MQERQQQNCRSTASTRLIVDLAEPGAEIPRRPDLRGAGLDLLSQVLSAMAAGVELGQAVHHGPHEGLLRGRGRLGVVGLWGRGGEQVTTGRCCSDAPPPGFGIDDNKHTMRCLDDDHFR